MRIQSYQLFPSHQHNIPSTIEEVDIKSPITLLELGEFLTSEKLIVICEEDFYRYGNVRIMCERFNVPLFNSYEEGVEKLIDTLKNNIMEGYEDF